MAEPHTAIAGRSRERWIVAAIAGLLVLARSAVFIWRPESYFDADQAVFGLMAKHLAEGRAFPLFMYGQSYILGVEAWMAAPLFALFGASPLLLKLPLLLVNLAIAWLLLRALERDAGLRPALAAIAIVPFVLPSVGLAAALVEPSGGNVEPYLYVLLIWLTRRQPILCGAIAAVGFLQRPFVLYGVLALIVVDALRRAPQTGRRLASMLAAAAVVWLIVQGLRPLSSGSGPGTSVDELYGASNNVLELAARTCVSPSTALAGTARLFSIHFPALLGTAPMPVSAFAIESVTTRQGLAYTSWIPLAAVLVAGAGVFLAWRRGPHPVPAFAAYLLIAGALSPAGYVLGRCGEVAFTGMRYELLSVLGLAGLWAAFLATHPPRVLAILWAALVAVWLLVVAVPHVRFAQEYAAAPPVPAKMQLIQVLRERGIRYGTADYWIAYYVTFMTRERMIVAATDVKRIRTYDAIVAAHPDAVHLSRRPCNGGEALIPGVYRCP
jgi:hypothetical protein